MLDHATLLTLLHYDPETGMFTWKARPGPVEWNTKHAGHVAGCLMGASGYVSIRIRGHLYAAHRLAWLYVHGKWPHKGLDHRDLCRSNNRIANLRPASQAENMGNTTLTRINTSGVKGVSWHKQRQKWHAQIRAGGKRFNLGLFDNLEEAKRVRDDTAKRLHGEFARMV